MIEAQALGHDESPRHHRPRPRAATPPRCRSTSTRSRCCATSAPLAIPSVVGLARIALEAGAHGITVHPRPDERHIRASDVRELAALLKDWPEAEFNIEGNPFHNLMPLRARAAPASVHLRARRRGAVDLRPRLGPRARRRRAWRRSIAEARALGVRVSLFMDADAGRDGAGRRRSAPTASSSTPSRTRSAWGTAGAGERRSPRSPPPRGPRSALGLGVNAGHDLNRDNLGAFLAAVPGVLEVSIGHAFDRRRARARHGRDGARLPARHRVGVGRRDRGAACVADDLRHRHRPLRRAPHPRRRSRAAASASPSACSAPHEIASSTRAAPSSRSAASATSRRASRPRRRSRRRSASACACR